MNETPNPQPEFASAFETALAGLQAAVLHACQGTGEWQAKTAAALEAVVEFAIEDPAGARTLTLDAFQHGLYGDHLHRRMVAYFANLIATGRELCDDDTEPPSITEEALVGAIAAIISERLRTGEERPLRALVPELVEMALTPYVGVEEAKRTALELDQR